MSANPAELPLFPLRSALFPGQRLRLRIFERRYLDLVSESLRENTGFGIPPILEGREAGQPAVPHPVGTVARIIDWDQGPQGLLSLVVEGSRRFRLRSHRTAARGLLRGEIEWLPDWPGLSLPPALESLPALVRKLETPQVWQVGERQDELYLPWRLIACLGVPVSEQVRLLALESPAELLDFCRLALAQLPAPGNVSRH